MKILIVDDEIKPLNMIIDRIDDLKKRVNDYSSVEYRSAMDMGSVNTLCDENTFDLALVDYSWDDNSTDGYKIAKFLKDKFPNIFVVIVSANTEHFVKLKTAESESNTNYIDLYQPKPITNIRDIEMAIKLANLYNEKKTLEKKLIASRAMNMFITKYEKTLTDKQKDFLHLEKPIIYYNQNFETCLEKASKAASSDASVIITGETGVGKELIASLVREKGYRKNRPLIAVNCSAIPSELIESELFGHEKGSFTGAHTMKKGKFEIANNGTLFLDEIGDMSLSAQAKVLRALQEKKIVRVGGTKEIPVDVRIIAATRKNLKKEMEIGNFRDDLFFRLNVISIHVLTLKERGQKDIELLSHYFLFENCIENSKNINFDSDSLKKLISTNYNFPGNIRELENMIERLVIFADKNISINLLENHVPELFRQYTTKINSDSSKKNIIDNKNMLREFFEDYELDPVRKELQKYEDKYNILFNEFLEGYKNYKSLKPPTIKDVSKSFGYSWNHITQRFSKDNESSKQRRQIARYLFINELTEFKIKAYNPFNNIIKKGE